MTNKPNRTTFHERMDFMITSIRNDIYMGKWLAGEYLPSLNLLSDEYYLSKNSIQKGLQILVDEMLIEKVPRVGIKVVAKKEKDSAIIRFGYYPSLTKTAQLMELVAFFHAKYPLIEVKLIPLQYENYKEVVSHYLLTGLLDVVAISDINFHQMIDEVPEAHNLFEPVKISEKIYSFLSSPFEFNRQGYAQPFIFSPVILAYNKEHFNETEVGDLLNNWGWGDFSVHLEKLNGKDAYRYPFYFHPTSNNRWPIFLFQSGVNFEKSGKKVTRKDIHLLMDGIQTCYDLIHKQKILPASLSVEEEKVEELFSQGKISVMMTTYMGLNELIDSKIEFDIAPLPYVHKPQTLAVAVGLAVNNHSKQKRLAQRFIDFLISEEAQLHIRKETLSVPALVKAAEWRGEEVIYRPAHFMLFKDIIPTYHFLADLHLSQSKRIQLLNSLKLYWMGLESKEVTADYVEGIFKK